MTRARPWFASLATAVVVGACGPQRPDHPTGAVDAPAGGADGAIDAPGTTSDGAIDAGTDGSTVIDGSVSVDAYVPDAPIGVITGGPCMSGTAGASAYRIRWAGNGSGSTAYPVYEGNGLPDHSRDHVGAYGYQIGFTPRFEDVFLAQGGLRLDSSAFVDIELSTVGVSQITRATLSIYGRSFNTTSPGSFTWQTFDGTGAAPANLVSNSAPYEWYSADMTTEISPGDDGVLVRIKAGPSSGVLVVNRIEICMEAS